MVIDTLADEIMKKIMAGNKFYEIFIVGPQRSHHYSNHIWVLAGKRQILYTCYKESK